VLAIVVTEYLTGATYALVETILMNIILIHIRTLKKGYYTSMEILCCYAIECGTKQ
jgi:hypothetical protein